MGASQKILIVVVDGQEFFRIGVRAALTKHDRIDIVAEGSTKADALRLTHIHNPDVLLFGLNTLDQFRHPPRNLSELDIIRSLVKIGKTRVLTLSHLAHKGLIHAALKAGASGFMMKDEVMASCDVLVQAIESLSRKRKLPLSPSLYEKLFLHEPEIQELPQLTKRRIEIMQAIADNPQLTLTQVADLLGIAESTLRNNLSAISRTLETPSVSGAIIECVRLGVVKICH